MEKKTGPPAVAVSDMETLDKLKGYNAVVVVGVFKDAESDAAKEYVKAAAAIELGARLRRCVIEHGGGLKLSSPRCCRT